MWLSLIFLACTFVSASAADRYAVVVDAGSTGSRAYSFKIAAEGAKRVSTLRRTSAEGGLATYIKNPAAAKSCVLPLILKVAALIPSEFWDTTEFSVRATGGMRTLSAEDQTIVWQGLIDGLKADPTMPFAVDPNNFGTITGDKEAYYAVLSANYIADRIDDKLLPIPGTQLIGALDMGGSSTQMIYHLGSEAAGENDFWAYSWTSYGASSAREKVWSNIIAHHLTERGAGAEAGTAAVELTADGAIQPTVHHVPNPCAYRGHVEETEHMHTSTEGGEATAVKVVLSGVGDPVQCGKHIRRTLWNDTETHDSCVRRSAIDELTEPNEHNCCQHEDEGDTGGDRMACSLDSVELPHMPAQYEFYAMSAYFFAFDCIRELGTYELANWYVLASLMHTCAQLLCVGNACLILFMMCV
jgi:hypothetical protein